MQARIVLMHLAFAGAVRPIFFFGAARSLPVGPFVACPPTAFSFQGSLHMQVCWA
jgi:hypothetical protein